ncbi:hypothetical protein AZ78_1648 [Lysobacter capsici AZ78]|uniref:Uncharacterized protein n=1 Tax=Lysobacter capsici AZ78 TaxID=1444315 RepID=A0A108U7R6_9GAMM|nr:hypothetical protein AZ78_1648 [Lysobacter capsici AZ78]
MRHHVFLDCRYGFQAPAKAGTGRSARRAASMRGRGFAHLPVLRA